MPSLGRQTYKGKYGEQGFIDVPPEGPSGQTRKGWSRDDDDDEEKRRRWWHQGIGAWIDETPAVPSPSFDNTGLTFGSSETMDGEP